ncbi:interleukin-1 receptor-associated kinase-like 2 isoform X2 [Pristis pectinata]|uniref:interleukin-1 receptor-associated kinase-like 2 isoform X2 n=1 Tax=Pristis pectinata TaxID=685728 RepID=UPI00223D98F3|nr:interleukin-1 receptor-associated kinase-like 2 isoform X2 [Pristis pectinata]
MDLFGRRRNEQQRNTTASQYFVYDIPAKIMEEFYAVMDTLAPGVWHRFGSCIITDQTELRNIESFGRKPNSRTRELMWAWGMKQATVQQLLDVLNEMQLYRAACVIMSWKPEDSFIVQPASSHLPLPETPEVFQSSASSNPLLDCMVDVDSDINVHKLDPLPGPSSPPSYLNSKPNCDRLEIPSSGTDDISHRPHQETNQPPELCSCTWSLLDLQQATDNFNERYKIGQGTFGHVYKAKRFNTEYAIKLLNKLEDVKLKITRDFFCREVETLYQYRHSNIMALEGYCAENDSYCLIYQYMSNGSLEDKLQCKNPADMILWETRIKIAVGTARAVQYLHQCNVPLIHGNIKSSNILLDEYFTPKLGDFGLVKIGPLSTDASQINSHTTLKTKTLQRPLAYLPDEFVRHRWLSEKVDTFSFGIVLAEILTGMKAVDESRQPAFLKDLVLEELEAEKQMKNGADPEKTAYKICQLYLDTKAGLLPLNFAVRFAIIACLCIKKKTLKMTEVYSMLETLEHDLKHCDVHSSPEETEDVVCKLNQLALRPQENTEILSPSLDPNNNIKSLQPQSPTIFKGLSGNSEQLPDAKLPKVPCESDESDIFCYYPAPENPCHLSCKVYNVKTKCVCSDDSSCFNRGEDNSKTNTLGCKSNSHFVQELPPPRDRVSDKPCVPRDYSSAALNAACEFSPYPKDRTANSFNQIRDNYKDCSKGYCCNSDVSPMLSVQSGDKVSINSKSPSRDPSYQGFNISELCHEACAFEHPVEYCPGVPHGTSPVALSSSSIEIGPHKKKLQDKILLYEEGKIDSAELLSAFFVTEGITA